jgi:electron transport complex protein RnfA
VQGTEMIVRATSPLLHELLGVFLPLITTNCAVLGVALINLERQHGFVESLVFGAAAAAGFGLALLLFAGLRERMDTADVPSAFRGTPIALVTAGLMALAFMGFNGLVGR